jgi:hypothetical protein
VLTGGEMYWDANSFPAIINNIFRHYGCYDSYAVSAGSQPALFNNNDVYNTIGAQFDPGGFNPPAGTGNINADPLFRDEQVRNFNLANNSSCLLPPADFIGAYGGDGLGNRIIASINVPVDYPTIQAALNAAIPGDIVNVNAGVYNENIIMKKGVVLLGAIAADGGPDITIIDGGGGGTVVFCDTMNNTTIISGFTIRNGEIGIECRNASDPYLVRNLINTNSVTGINIDNCRPWVEHNTIVDNNTGVSIDCNAPTIIHNIMASNLSTGLYGIINCGLITWIPTIYGNDVWGNSGNYGGDINDQTGINSNISENPLFVSAPNNYRLNVGSPCTPASSPTGKLIGAFPELPTLIADLFNDEPLVFYPNPMLLSGFLEYILSKDEVITIQLFDTKGMLLETFVSGQRQITGKHVQEIRFPEALAPGYYFIVISTKTDVKSLKIINAY